MPSNTIDSAINCLNDLRKIVISAFGPNGKQILIKTSTGSILMTKNAGLALQYFEMKDPIGRLIKDHIEKTTRRYGDFCKTQIIVLHILFTRFDQHMKKSQQTACLRRRLLIRALENIYLKFNNISHFNLANQKVKTMKSKELKDYVDLLVDAFLSGSLNPTLKKYFIEILMLFLKHVSFDSLFMIVDNFDFLAHVIEGFSFPDSKVLEGIIITREASCRQTMKEKVKFIIITGGMERVDRDGMELLMDGQSFLSNHFQNTAQIYSKFVNILKSNDINLIITEEKIPSNLAEQMIDINSISFVPEDEINFLLKCFNILPISSFYDIFNIESMSQVIGKSQYLRPITLGKRYACLLGPDAHPSNNYPCVSMVITSPHASLGNHIKELFHKFLCLLSKTVEVQPVQLIPAGGVFEAIVAKYFSTIGNKSKDHELEPIYGLLSQSFSEMVMVLGREFRYDNLKALQQYVLSIQNHICDDIKILNLINSTMSSSGETTDYEPFKLKCVVVCNVIQLCIQVLRIGNYVPVVNKTLSLRKTSDDEI